ncbi:ASCH domain-containing protein [Nocardiopsis protaetiae]|uniref:ASCH domain-containing protein n=1 Tax=Nocardiopsis protaetiae TaxID=3382270 RepID=UPI00387AD68E
MSADLEPWMLDTANRPGSIDALLCRVGKPLIPKELGRLMHNRPADLEQRPRTHEMGIYKRYFDLIASGRKTTEVRVDDDKRKRLAVGDLLRFRCRDEEVLTRITRLARYSTFAEMFDHEPEASTDPTANREEQLRNIRAIYPPEREALGVVAIGIEPVAGEERPA